MLRVASSSLCREVIAAAATNTPGIWVFSPQSLLHDTCNESYPYPAVALVWASRSRVVPSSFFLQRFTARRRATLSLPRRKKLVGSGAMYGGLI